MIGGLKPYPKMKDSGVPWLGAVPEHWEVQKFKYAVSFSGGGTPSKAEASYWHGSIPWVSPKDMRVARITDAADHISEAAVDASTTSLVKPGAVLLVVRSGILRRTIPVAINAVEVALNQDMKALRPRRGVVQSEYLRALIQGNEQSLLAEWTKQGATVESIEQEYLASSRVPLPPLPEQASIVRFLDHADRRIQRYIRAKQKLIKLLEEQKQAIIHRAVTRGLDPNVRLKPSGVEWLGEVPEHWEVSRVKNEFLCLNRRRVPLSATERGAMTLRRYDYYGASGIIDKVDEYLFDDELLLVAEDGANLVLRNLPLAIIARGQFWVNNHAHILKLRRGRLEYLAAVMERINYQPWISGAAQPKLTQDRLMGIAIAVAPPEEQDRIVRAISEETAPLSTTIERARREIVLLREYRTRLIADVVTGKLDVRQAAARLPDEGDEPDLFDVAEAESDTDETADDLDAAAEEAAT